MNKYTNLILLAVVLGFNFLVRIQPAYLLFTRDSAINSVNADFLQKSEQRVTHEFKDVPAQIKGRMVLSLFDSLKKERKSEFDQAVTKKQKELKSKWQDDSGQTFLLEADSYHWLRLLRNLVTSGSLGDKITAKAEYDTFMLAPLGVKIDASGHKNLHVFLSHFIFKLVHIFYKNVTLEQFAFYMPVFISMLVLLAVFFMCSSLTSSEINLAGFFAALILGISSIFLDRSMAGWFDTDTYIILFCILSTWTLYLSFSEARAKGMRLIFALTSGFCVGLFSFTWDGWWYIFGMLVLSALVYALNLHSLKLKVSPAMRPGVPVVPIVAFVISSVIFVGVFSGWDLIKDFHLKNINAIFNKSALPLLENGFWPNAFVTVSELKKGSILRIVNNTGGMLLLVFACFYLLYLFYDKRSKESIHKQFIGFLFAFWVSITLYISTNAIRFSLLLTIPVAITAGLFLDGAFVYLGKFSDRTIKIPKIRLLLLFILMLSFLPGCFYALSHAREVRPQLDRTLWKVLNKIKTDTPKNAIINSWWDYGHLFKAVAERPVIFDGATQNTPLSYWMGRVLSSDSEKEAVGILRMLNSGSNQAFEELERLGFDKRKCMDILNQIIILKRKDAEEKLAKYLSRKDDRERILQYTHNPRPAYFVLEPSLQGKLWAISALGGWDFKKADIYENFKKYPKQAFLSYLAGEYKYKPDEARKLYDMLSILGVNDIRNWISPPYTFIEDSTKPRKEGNLLFFDNDYVVELTGNFAYFDDAEKGAWRIPKSIFYVEGGKLKENNLANGEMSNSVLLIQNKDNYELVSLDGKLARSLFVRLYYLGGLGLESFEPFIKEELNDAEGQIIVYKLNWDAEVN